jgi:hypothetical protein
MPSKKIAMKEKSVDKEKMLKTIVAQLETAFPGLKEHFGDKKFEKRINKAAKIIVEGIKQTPTKKAVPSIKKVKIAKKKTAKILSKK